MAILAAHFDPLADLMPPFGVMAVVNAIIFYTLFCRVRFAAAGRGTARSVLIVAAAFPLLAISSLNALNHREWWHPGVADNLLRLAVTSLPSSLLLAVALVQDTRSWVVGLVPLAAVAASCLIVATTLRWEFAFAIWQLVCAYGLIRLAQPAWVARFRPDFLAESNPSQIVLTVSG